MNDYSYAIITLVGAVIILALFAPLKVMRDKESKKNDDD